MESLHRGFSLFSLVSPGGTDPVEPTEERDVAEGDVPSFYRKQREPAGVSTTVERGFSRQRTDEPQRPFYDHWDCVSGTKTHQDFPQLFLGLTEDRNRERGLVLLDKKEISCSYLPILLVKIHYT